MNTTDLMDSVARAIHMATSDDEPTEYAMIVARTEARAAILETLRQIREPSAEAGEAFCRAYERPLSRKRWESHFGNGWEAVIDQLISEIE